MRLVPLNRLRVLRFCFCLHNYLYLFNRLKHALEFKLPCMSNYKTKVLAKVVVVHSFSYCRKTAKIQLMLVISRYSALRKQYWWRMWNSRSRPGLEHSSRSILPKSRLVSSLGNTSSGISSWCRSRNTNTKLFFFIIPTPNTWRFSSALLCTSLLLQYHQFLSG